MFHQEPFWLWTLLWSLILDDNGSGWYDNTRCHLTICCALILVICDFASQILQYTVFYFYYQSPNYNISTIYTLCNQSVLSIYGCPFKRKSCLKIFGGKQLKKKHCTTFFSWFFRLTLILQLFCGAHKN